MEKIVDLAWRMSLRLSGIISSTFYVCLVIFVGFGVTNITIGITFAIILFSAYKVLNKFNLIRAYEPAYDAFTYLMIMFTIVNYIVIYICYKYGLRQLDEELLYASVVIFFNFIAILPPWLWRKLKNYQKHKCI